MSSETYIDHGPFISSSFDVNAYANAILAGETYDPDADARIGASESKGLVNGVSKGKEKEAGYSSGTGRGDVGLALAKLNYGIEDITKQLRQEITTHHPLLLTHLSTSTHLLSSLTLIRSSLLSLDTSLTRLHSKIHLPHSDLSILVSRLNKTREASDLARRAGRFLVLAKRLEGQMRVVKGSKGPGQGQGEEGEWEEGEREREMAKAALSIAELDTLVAPSDPSSSSNTTADDLALESFSSSQSSTPLTSLHFVSSYIPMITQARETIIREMEGMVVQGLANLNQALLSTSLQTAYNLRLLPQLVSNLLADLNEAVEARIGKVFDVVSIGKEVASKDQSSSSTSATSLIYRSRPKTSDNAPTPQTLPLWQAALWRRFENLIEDVANCCIKVYVLEKVLKKKRDTAGEGGGDFLEEVMKLLDEKPSFTFWTTLATAFDNQTREACNSSTFLQQTLSVGYPKLLRLFHDFFAKISVHTSTTYSSDFQSPETVLILRSINKFENLYLTRSTGRMSEAVSAALAARPGSAEGVAVARVLLNELDTARFDPLLVRGVARNVVRSLEGFVGKIEGMIVKDFSANSLIGPLATQGQVINASLVSCLYHLTQNLLNSATDFSARVADLILPAITAAIQVYTKVTDALNIALKREISSIIGRIHRVDFSKPVDPMSMGAGGSPYIKDLGDKLNFVRTEILGKMSLGEMGREWVLSLVKHAINAFIMNASIARPLGESGKLKLTSDMTELEFALGTFLTTGAVSGAKSSMRLDRAGDSYKALRAFRTMLFLDPSSLTSPSETAGLPSLIVLHHLIVLSPLQLPHQIHEWSQAEYVLWVDKHPETDAWKLLEKAVNGQNAGKGAIEWRELIGNVLSTARGE